jgi:hypothetical protein
VWKDPRPAFPTRLLLRRRIRACLRRCTPPPEPWVPQGAYFVREWARGQATRNAFTSLVNRGGAGGRKRRADAHPRGRRAGGRLPCGGPASADLLTPGGGDTMEAWNHARRP